MKRSPLKRKSCLSPVSKKRKEEMKKYSALRKAFLRKSSVCEVWLNENGWRQIFDYQNVYMKKENGLSFHAHADQLIESFGAPIATDVHHAKKRGKHYLDVSSWMAVCRENHQRIHDNPAWAREKGYLA